MERPEDEKKRITEEIFYIDPEYRTDLNAAETDPLYAEAYLDDPLPPEDGFSENTTSFD